MTDARRPEGLLLDAMGTLIGLRRSVGSTYAAFAAEHGVIVEAEAINAVFPRLFRTAPPLAFPGLEGDALLAADFVSLLAAVVLYLLSVGSVRGFAFALGLTTLVDLFVVYIFTKPLMTIMARLKFFNSGHRFSGLSDKSSGVTRTTSSVEA